MPDDYVHQAHELRHEEYESEDGQSQQRVGEDFAANVSVKDAHGGAEPSSTTHGSASRGRKSNLKQNSIAFAAGRTVTNRPRKIPDATNTKIRQMREAGYGIPIIAPRSRIGLASVSRAITQSKTQGVRAV